MKTTNYYNTFIAIAEDCPVSNAEIPPEKEHKKSVATLQYELLKTNRYKLTSDEVVFSVFAIKNQIEKEDLDREKEKFFSKGQACLRTSPLAKRYGWGIHFDKEGKIALLKAETEEYQKLLADKRIKQLKAMRSKRNK